MAKYTDQMVAELRAIEELNFEKANAFATEHSLTVRSVIAKARALNVPYQAKAPGKVKDSIRRKEEITASIESALGLKLPSLVKMTVPDLLKLENASAGL